MGGRSITSAYCLERVLPAGFIVSLDGILVDGRNIPIKRNLREWGVEQILNRGEAEARILQVRLRKSFATGSFDVQYTLADRKATNDVWLDYTPQVDWQDEDFSSELGPASWDQRHQLVGWADARLPLEFVIGLKFLYYSARPYNAVTGTDDNGDGFGNDRPPGEGRNARRGPDFTRVDVGVTKWFRVGGGEVGLAFNIYNVFNHTNYDAKSVVGNLQSSLFGEALSADVHARENSSPLVEWSVSRFMRCGSASTPSEVESTTRSRKRSAGLRSARIRSISLRPPKRAITSSSSGASGTRGRSVS